MVRPKPTGPEACEKSAIGNARKEIELLVLGAVALIVAIEFDNLPAVQTPAPRAPPHVKGFAREPPNVAANLHQRIVAGQPVPAHVADGAPRNT